MNVNVEDVKIENIKTNVVKLEITVDKETFEEGLQKSFSKNAKKFSVQGFRAGKAPRAMVERIYGPEVLYEDAVNYILPDAYELAVKQNEIIPVDYPEYDIVSMEKGSNLVFTAEVTIKPEVELGEYKNIKVEKVETTISDSDVDAELEKVAKQNSRLVPVEDRAVENGDTAYIDYEGFVDDVAFEGGKGENYGLEIGSNTFIPGFEEQLIGAEIGSEPEVKVTFPEEYHSEELAGAEAVFKCKINEIKTREIPTIDDDFAKDVSEFDTLDEYKASIKEKLIEEAEKSDKRANENNIVKKVSENAKSEIPEVMIEKQINAHLQEVDRSLSYQGLSLDQYIKITNTDIEELKNQFRESSENEVKAQLVIEAIGKAEDIVATDDEFNERVAEFGKQYNKDADEMMKLFRDEDIEYIKSQLVYEKTIDFLVENADYSVDK